MIEALFQIFIAIIEISVAAPWRHDFPERPHDHGRPDRVGVVPRSPAHHPLWDGDVDSR